MSYQFPIHIDIKKPKMMLVQQAFILSVSAMLFYKTFGYNGIIFFSSFMGITVIVSAILRFVYKSNLKKPKFSIYEDHLVVKSNFLRFINYPFDLFKGRVYLKRRLLEWHIYVPNAPEGKQYIYISCLAKPERDRFVAILKDLIES